MSPLSIVDLTLLAGFCTLLFVGAILSLLVLRVSLIRLEDATAAYEILHEHPDLVREQQWSAWTDSVGLSRDEQNVSHDAGDGFHDIITGRAA